MTTWPFAEYVTLSDLAAKPRRFPPETEHILHLADSLRSGVTARARKRGASTPFGRAASLAALHALSVWVSQLPPAQRAAVMESLR